MKQLSELVTKLVKTYFKNINAVAEEEDLTPMQMKILRILENKDLIIQKEIADKAYAEPAAVSRAIDGMSEKGLVKRNQSDESRRCFEIELTPFGVEKIAAINKKYAELEERILKNLSGGEVEQLKCLLEKILNI